MSIREGQRYEKNKERYLERDYKRREREKEEREREGKRNCEIDR